MGEVPSPSIRAALMTSSASLTGDGGTGDPRLVVADGGGTVGSTLLGRAEVAYSEVTTSPVAAATDIDPIGATAAGRRDGLGAVARATGLGGTEEDADGGGFGMQSQTPVRLSAASPYQLSPFARVSSMTSACRARIRAAVASAASAGRGCTTGRSEGSSRSANSSNPHKSHTPSEARYR